MSGILRLPPHCLVFLVDDTGHEEFADQNYPVFGLGGCAVMMGVMDANLRDPWRAMKLKFFGGANVRLHAFDMKSASPEQLEAIGQFFRTQPFGRFAVTMTSAVDLEPSRRPYAVMPGVVRKRWEELASRCEPTPTEIAILHEASDRGDKLVKRYFGPTVAEINGQRVPVHHGFVPKSAGDEGMEVADFIVNAAGGQALQWGQSDQRFRQDFKAVFHANSLWSSFMHVGGEKKD